MRAAAVEHRVLTTWCRRRFRKLQTTSRVLATTFITAVRTPCKFYDQRADHAIGHVIVQLPRDGSSRELNNK